MNSTPFVIIIIPFSPRGRGGGGTGRSLASSIAFQLTFFVTDSFRSNWPIRCKICGTQACQGLGLRSRLCLVQFWIWLASWNRSPKDVFILSHQKVPKTNKNLASGRGTAQADFIFRLVTSVTILWTNVTQLTEYVHIYVVLFTFFRNWTNQDRVRISMTAFDKLSLLIIHPFFKQKKVKCWRFFTFFTAHF